MLRVTPPEGGDGIDGEMAASLFGGCWLRCNHNREEEGSGETPDTWGGRICEWEPSGSESAVATLSRSRSGQLRCGENFGEGRVAG